MRKVLLLGVGLAVIVLGIILGFSSVITHHYFDGDWWMLIALVVAFAAYAPAHLARGIASGNGRFRLYAVVMGADGVVRIMLASGWQWSVPKSAGAYGFAVAVAPLAGVLFVALRGQLRSEDGPPATWSEVTPNLGWLLLGTVFAAVLVNAGPVATNLLASDDEGGRSPSSPTACSWPVAVPLPGSAGSTPPPPLQVGGANQIDEFRSGFRRLMNVVLVVGAVSAWSGPSWLGRP